MSRVPGLSTPRKYTDPDTVVEAHQTDCVIPVDTLNKLQAPLPRPSGVKLHSSGVAGGSSTVFSAGISPLKEKNEELSVCGHILGTLYEGVFPLSILVNDTLSGFQEVASGTE